MLRSRALLSALCALVMALVLLPPARPAHAANFTVTRTDDPVPGACTANDCSLREAVIAANAAPGSAITLPAGTYNLQQSGPGPTGGDLNITTSVSINGAGANVTFIDAHGLDRVFEFTGPNSDIAVSGVTIRGGDAVNLVGGGIMARNVSEAIVRSVTLTDLVATGNHAATSGGGLYLSASLITINRVTLADNTAGQGAGLQIEDSSTVDALTDSVTLTNVTISHNVATGPGGGIAITSSPVSLSFSTITGNAGTFGGGLITGGPVTVRATMFANNTASNTGPNCYPATGGSITSGGFSFDSGTSCGFTAVGLSTDRNNVNPNLGALQNNGGQTPTHAIGAGSPALDWVNAGTCPSTDQRGIPRPQDGQSGNGDHCDVGAFEYRPTANLGITLTDSPDPVQVGDTITYTALVSNSGPQSSLGTIVTDTLPAGLQLNSINSNVGTCTFSSASCNVGTLASGGFATITVSVHPTAYGVFTNTITVGGTLFDPSTANNTAFTTTTVNPDCTPRPRITQTVSHPSAGVIRVQLTAVSTSGTPNNKIASVRFLATPNATLELPQGGASGFQGSFLFGLSPSVTTFTFLISRSAAGAFTARYEVNDFCGAYPLFAGGGTGVS